METLLINEQFVSQFKYWREGQVQTGMRFRNDLFECVSEFNRHQRNQAFDLAWQLSQTGKQAVVTTSSKQYTVWISLRAIERSSAVTQLNLAVANHFTAPPELVLQPALSA